MNRIKIGPLATQSKKLNTDATNLCKTDLLPHEEFAPHRNGEFSLFVPVHYESSYAYPLIVWLHQDGSACDELQKLMPQVSCRNHIAVAPQSSFAQVSPIAWPDTAESVEAAYESVLACIEDANRRFNINPDRIFIAGTGTGGSMALQLAFQRPDIFAGVASIDGPMDAQQVPLHDWEMCRNLNVLLSTFRNSLSYCEDELCHSLRLLHVAGFSTTVRQYPGDVRLSPKVLSDLNGWVMEQIGSTIS